MITLIAAVGENNVLGKDNKIIWHLPDDFKHFKELTSHHYIIMGRKTFESFPKPLPNRTHIVITRQKDYVIEAENCFVVHSLEKAISLANTNEDIYVIGGGEIYALAWPIADKIELTQIHHSFEGDAFFPPFSKANWKLVKEIYHPKDEKHLYDFTFQTFLKK